MLSPKLLLGHPDAFDQFYPGQWEAVQAIQEWYFHSPARFMGLSAPTGSGKSLLATLTGRLSGAKTVMLTQTKGLQDQLMADFAPVGMEDLRGQGNYQCLNSRVSEWGGYVSVEDGPCHDGENCSLRSSGCTYYDQLQVCQGNDVVVTNYAAWLTLQNYSQESLDDVELLVCDEGHDAFSAMESFLSFDLTDADCHILGYNLPENAADWDWDEWVQWWKLKYPEGETRREKRVAREFNTNRGKVLRSDRPWCVEERGNGYEFIPVWPSKYKDSLFQDVPKVLLMSADLTRKHCYQLGIEPGELDWYDMPSYFPAERTPIYYVPTVKMRYNMSAEELSLWRARIEQIVLGRMDRKGIVFTTSYNYQRYLLENAKSIPLMGHTNQNTRQVVREFKQSPPPRVLVSPAVGTGWDFPNDEGRYGVVSKLPWPNTKSKVHQIRKKEDPEYEPHMIMGELVQQTGRLTRSQRDWSELFIVDDQASWLIPKYKGMCPKWWQERYLGRRDLIPEPPPLSS